MNLVVNDYVDSPIASEKVKPNMYVVGDVCGKTCLIVEGKDVFHEFRTDSFLQIFWTSQKDLLNARSCSKKTERKW